VGDTTSYEVRTCLPVGGGLPQPKHWWPADGDTNDAVGDVDIGNLWGAYGAGWDGADPTQRSWTFDGRRVPAHLPRARWSRPTARSR
jgi:hypothetical protein